MKPDAPIDCVLCRCHGEIDSVVDFARLCARLQDDPRVNSVTIQDALCLPEAADALARRLDGTEAQVLIAACSRLARAGALADGLAGRGIHRSRLYNADIREGCAWIHGADPVAATLKAGDIAAMGLAALCGRKASLDPQITVQSRVLVIGGGPAGLKAAAALGRAGVAVTLVESTRQLGGMLNRLSRVGPGERSAQELRDDLVGAVEALETAQICTGVRVADIQGAPGDFSVTLSDGAALAAGAVIVATGAMPVLPQDFSTGRRRGVISAMELEKAFRDGTPEAADTVFIQCVEVRNPQRPYCSAICCPTALKNAIRLKQIDPATRVAICHRDIMSCGQHLEAEYRRAAAAGVRFVRFDPADPPWIEGGEAVSGVRVHDVLAGKERLLPAARVVFATALKPRVATGGKDPLAAALGLKTEKNGFYEVRPYLHSVETTAPGVMVCGAARWPALVDTALAQGAAAAAKALDLVAHPVRRASELIGFQPQRAGCARVTEETCIGCGNCSTACPYGACRLEPTASGLRAAVDPVRCMGCGSCQAACPSGSIVLPECDPATLVQMMTCAFNTNREPQNGNSVDR